MPGAASRAGRGIAMAAAAAKEAHGGICFACRNPAAINGRGKALAYQHRSTGSARGRAGCR